MSTVLMISLGDALLRQPDGDAARRHLDYAARLGGHIDIVTHSPLRAGRSWGTALAVHPTGAAGYARFV